MGLSTWVRGPVQHAFDLAFPGEVETEMPRSSLKPTNCTVNVFRQGATAGALRFMGKGCRWLRLLTTLDLRAT